MLFRSGSKHSYTKDSFVCPDENICKISVYYCYLDDTRKNLAIKVVKIISSSKSGNFIHQTQRIGFKQVLHIILLGIGSYKTA